MGPVNKVGSLHFTAHFILAYIIKMAWGIHDESIGFLVTLLAII